MVRVRDYDCVVFCTPDASTGVLERGIQADLCWSLPPGRDKLARVPRRDFTARTRWPERRDREHPLRRSTPAKTRVDEPVGGLLWGG